MNEILPESLEKYFWDCDFREMSMDKYAFFIAERILNFGDMAALKWLLLGTDKSFLEKLVRTSRNLDKKTKNYWKIILHDDKIAY